MTSQATSTVHRICPSCDAEQHADADAEPICPKCGARLVELNPKDDLIGTTLDGRFEIRDRLGEGGMGTVYRAWQKSIGREIAIKLIDRRYSRDAMSVRRFLREARLSSQLSQPNTVSVFDFGQCGDGRLFIAMELIRGRTLEEVLGEDGPFPVSRAAWVGVQLCDALEAAHNLDIVHRDLKPANVIVLDEPPGRDLLKVVDFGLAKSLTSEESGSTQTGLVVGTPRYLAPEAATGSRATPAVDLYALGVILAELTTGKVLWQSTSFAQLIGAKLQGSPVVSEVPVELRDLVDQLIAPDPLFRPESASAVRAVLAGLVDDPGSNVPTGARRIAKAATPRPNVGTPTVVAKKPSSTSNVVGNAATEALPSTPSGAAIAPAAPSVVTAPVTAPAKRPPWAVIGVGVVAVAAIGVWLATRGGDAEPAAPAEPKTADPARVAAPPAVDAGVVEVAPPDAAVTVPAVDPVEPPPTPPKKKDRGKGKGNRDGRPDRKTPF